MSDTTEHRGWDIDGLKKVVAVVIPEFVSRDSNEWLDHCIAALAKLAHEL